MAVWTYWGHIQETHGCVLRKSIKASRTKIATIFSLTISKQAKNCHHFFIDDKHPFISFQTIYAALPSA